MVNAIADDSESTVGKWDISKNEQEPAIARRRNDMGTSPQKYWLDERGVRAIRRQRKMNKDSIGRNCGMEVEADHPSRSFSAYIICDIPGLRRENPFSEGFSKPLVL